MAEEPKGLEGEEGGEAEPAAADPSAKKFSDKIVLNGRFELHPELPYPDLSLPNAQAFKAADKRDPQSELFVLICNPDLPTRTNEMRVLKGSKAKGLLPLVEWGAIYWPLFNRRTMAVVYERPLGGKAFEPTKKYREVISEQHMIRNVITPLYVGLQELAQRSIVHRSIRPENIFYMDEEKTDIVFGDMVTCPFAYDQPPVYETIEMGMCQPEGRGEGNYSDDIYSFGVSMYTIYTKKASGVGMSTNEIVDTKIAVGTYPFMVKDNRLPIPMVEILRGLMCDDADERWKIESLEMWMDGRRLSPLQPKQEPRAKRNILFLEHEYGGCRELAIAMRRNWKAGIELIESGELELWLRRGLENKELSERVEVARKLTLATAGDKTSVNDMLIAKVLMHLDPNAPLRYLDLDFMPESIGTMLAVSMIKKGDARQVANVIMREVLKVWTETREKHLPEHSLVDSEFRDLRGYLRQPLMGLGLERALYEGCEALPCQSPLVLNDYVVEINELLPALESASKNADPKTWPFDRHIAAFIAARFKQNSENHLTNVGDPNPATSLMGMLGLFGSVQWRIGPEALLDLSIWIGGLMGPVIGSYHNREKRRALEKELPKIVRRGNLVELYNLLDNKEERYLDVTSFSEAKVEYSEAKEEIDYLESGKVGRDEQADKLGHQTAAVTSVTISLMVIAVMIALRVW